MRLLLAYPILCGVCIVGAVGWYTIRAGTSLTRDWLTERRADRAAARAAENARRRAVHPAGRDVTKRLVFIAPESPAMWAELEYYEGEDAR